MRHNNKHARPHQHQPHQSPPGTIRARLHSVQQPRSHTK
jgi:hypothetical protein